MKIVDDDFELSDTLNQKLGAIDCNEDSGDRRQDHECPEENGKDAPLLRSENSLQDDITVQQQTRFLQLLV